MNEIVHCKCNITANTALCLVKYFSNSPDFRMGLQADYDLDNASDQLEQVLVRDVKVFSQTT